MRPSAIAPLALAATLFLAGAASAQTQTAQTGGARETPRGETAAITAELAACKATGLAALIQRDPTLRDIVIDEEGLTVATADTKIEDTPVRRIVIGEAYLQSNRRERPRRFLCIVGEKGKVLLTFFTRE